MGVIKPIPYQKLVKIFEAAGCTYSHTKGDHMIFHHENAMRPVVIPKYKEIPVFIIKNNMKVIKLSREEYLELESKL
jgi:predicted RNA binding protein YcfA (HicA-like mRNA interferase family)